MYKHKVTAELLAYAAVVNGYVHTEQLIFINRTAKNDSDLKIIYNILLSDETYSGTSSEINVCSLREQLQSEPPRDQKRLEQQMLKLMCYDGEFDLLEREFMSKVFPKIKYNKLVIRHHLAFFRRRTRGNVFRRFVNKIKSLIFKNSVSYFNSRRLRFDGFIKNISQENRTILDLLSGTVFSEHISERLDKFNAEMEKLNKSEATVALAGKTKAGKSTLFSLLSGTARELIGKGTQRTSKCTVVTHYKGVKVVDTPGLAAGRERGRKDENLALQSCEDSDAVLFVLSTDTYNEIKEFVGILALKMYKPITVLFNYKDQKCFMQPYLNNLQANPQIWTNADTDNSIKGWANELLKYASENNFKHVFENRIHFSYLLVARFDKLKEHNIFGKTGRRIRKASGFDKFTSMFFNDFIRNGRMFRLARITRASIDFLDEIKDNIQILVSENNREFQEADLSVQAIKKILKNFEKRCLIKAEDVIDNIIGKKVQAEETNEKLKKLRKKKFNEYVNSLFDNMNSMILQSLNKMLTKEIKSLDSELYNQFCSMNEEHGSYGFNQAMPHPSLDEVQREPFKTASGINIFRMKELYIIPKKFLNLLPGPVSLVTDFAIDNATEKYTVSVTSIFNKRSTTREHEIGNLFEELKEQYLEEVKKQAFETTEMVIRSSKYRRLESKLSTCQEAKEKFGFAMQKISDAQNNTIIDYCKELLKIRQKRAHFKGYEVITSPDRAPQLSIFADNCKEEDINDMKYIICIRKEI